MGVEEVSTLPIAVDLALSTSCVQRVASITISALVRR